MVDIDHSKHHVELDKSIERLHEYTDGEVSPNTKLFKTEVNNFIDIYKKLYLNYDYDKIRLFAFDQLNQGVIKFPFHYEYLHFLQMLNENGNVLLIKKNMLKSQLEQRIINFRCSDWKIIRMFGNLMGCDVIDVINIGNSNNRTYLIYICRKLKNHGKK